MPRAGIGGADILVTASSDGFIKVWPVPTKPSNGPPARGSNECEYAAVFYVSSVNVYSRTPWALTCRRDKFTVARCSRLVCVIFLLCLQAPRTPPPPPPSSEENIRARPHALFLFLRTLLHLLQLSLADAGCLAVDGLLRLLRPASDRRTCGIGILSQKTGDRLTCLTVLHGAAESVPEPAPQPSARPSEELQKLDEGPASVAPSTNRKSPGTEYPAKRRKDSDKARSSAAVPDALKQKQNRKKRKKNKAPK